MSLKAFHILFIALSIMLAGGFGAWAISVYRTTAGVGYLGTAVLSFLAAGALTVYGVRFLAKCRRFGIT